MAGREVYNLGRGGYLFNISFSRMRVSHVSSSILGPEELEIWVWIRLSSQKGHELKQEYDNNFDHALASDLPNVGLIPRF